jgi:hypothetical protein
MSTDAGPPKRGPVAWLVFAAICLFGVFHLVRGTSEMRPAPIAVAPATVPAPTPQSPFQFATAFVEDIRQANWDAAFLKMERRYRDGASVKELRGNLEAITAFYGAPLAFTYKGQETGDRHYPDGTVKPYDKFWFAMPTKRHAEGVFAFVDIVADGDTPRVAVFSMLSFPNDQRPDMLR